MTTFFLIVFKYLSIPYVTEWKNEKQFVNSLVIAV